MTLHDKSIAVLPFVNMSPDADNEYFSDGMTEEIINALTAIKNVKVTARTSSFAFKGKATVVRSIGQQLGSHLQGVGRKRVRFLLIYIESIMGRVDKALRHVEEGVDFREPLMTLLRVDPLLKTTALVKEPKYQELLKTIYLKSDTQESTKENQESGPFTQVEIVHFTQR